MKEISQQDTSRIIFEVPSQLHKQLRIACVRDGISIKMALNKALEDYLNNRSRNDDEITP